MNTLIVTAHPDPDSLTASSAARLQEALSTESVELADLAGEGFDPRFGPDDRATYQDVAEAPSDVVREQRRLDAADHLVLVFPVYWWSMPALLKGWIDRVFVNGWAFEIDPEGDTRRLLGRLTVHLLAVAGDSGGTYERHGYETAMRTQIEHGVVDYVGARRGVTEFAHDSERDDAPGREAVVAGAVDRIARAVLGDAPRAS